jgi:glycosyltransferase involved in cell wall biosynthesis
MPRNDAFKGLKVALVHDWLVSRGGGERVLFDLHEMFPDAPIYTLVYDEQKAPAWCLDCDIRTTYLQKIPPARSHHKMLLSLMPRAWEALDLSEFDLVISSCSSCCKGVITRPDALHVCYCHSPIRYVWDLYYDYLAQTDPIRRAAMKRIIPGVREWDFIAAQRVDAYVSNSTYVGKRIKKYYRRTSTTIHPATPVAAHTVAEPGGYLLVVSRFVRYKRVDLAIEACNQLGRRLVVVGSGGEEEKRLRELAGPTIEFAGRVSDECLADLYAHADAFLFPGIEDYGLTPVEAMASGVPVLAYGEGGALETVSDGETGLFFLEQTSSALASCIERFYHEGVKLSRLQIAERAREQASPERFRSQMEAFLLERLIERGIVHHV